MKIPPNYSCVRKQRVNKTLGTMKALVEKMHVLLDPYQDELYLIPREMDADILAREMRQLIQLWKDSLSDFPNPQYTILKGISVASKAIDDMVGFLDSNDSSALSADDRQSLNDLKASLNTL